MAGLFDTFTIAKRGLNVNQAAINTTSHNIANADTKGYSRQRAVAETTRPFGGMSRFDATGAGQVGTGAEVTTIQRIRDSFIDYQVRSETGTSGYYTTKSDTLSKVEDIFGEPSDQGIQELMGQFFNSFQEVSKSPDKSDVKAVAIQKASSLADAINYAYNQLKKTCDDSQKVLESNVVDANSYLDQINELNKQIGSVSAVGQSPNDLMDKRDNLLDQLSYKFGLKLDKDKFETINLSSTEYPNSALVKSDPNDINYNRFSYVKSAKVENVSGTTYKMTVEYYPLGNEDAKVKSFELQGNESDLNEVRDNLLQNRILIADKDGNAILETPSTKATASTDGTATANVTTSSGNIDVKTTTTSAGAITIDINTTPASTISRSSTGVVTLDANATANGYKVTDNSDGSMYIKLSSDVTIEVAKDGTITTPAENLNQTTAMNLEKSIFTTYKYDSRTDAAGNTVNNVDSKYVKGDIAANQSVQETVQGYMDSLDRLAAGLAYSVNAIQTGNIDASDATLSQGLAKTLIFTNSDNKTTDDGITAANIKINSDLLKDPTLLNCNTSSTSGTGDGKRANAIANLNVLKMNLGDIASTADLTTLNRKTFLNAVGIGTSGTAGFSDTTSLNLTAGTEGSTADSYYKTIINNLAVQTQESTRQSDTQETRLANLEDQRSEISGVSLDEETTNLIQFQHAYQANAKMISTIDELLDVVINGLKK